MAEVTDIHILANLSNGSPNEEDAFVIRGPKDDEVIYKIHNLKELVELLNDIDPEMLFPSLCRENGEEFECDIALWIHYVLGDAVLSAKIYNLVKVYQNDPEKLKLEVFNLCFNRYLNFQEYLEYSEGFIVEENEAPPYDL